ncbi:fibronectin type III domain-containing protein, partial [Candidatus Gottesmanbacteria bacterium]|nr:fibronectin type III domain-containing protein [Candidatus Gottesmanbacteria bacterium]
PGINIMRHDPGRKVKPGQLQTCGRGVYYTTDGTTPDKTKTLYTGAITVDKDMTIKAIAYDNAGNASGVLSATYGIPPKISSETSSSASSTSVTITWTTDDPSTSRVIYDTVSHPELGSAPNYGYANSTVESDTAPKVTSHSVTISGLTPGTTYYYRTVSHGSPEAVGPEGTFTTSAAGGGGGGGGGAVAGASTGGGGGGGGGGASAPVCNDTKPGSAPTLTGASGGTNSVTLTWAEGKDPMSYYLVTYGTSPGAQTYGNPNIGGKGTTSYTVSGLAGGATYYFKVRAGNGCMPGDYSNELSATPGGGGIAGPAAGFAPGVLGAATQETTPSAELSPTPTPEEGQILGTKKGDNVWKWLAGLGFGGLFLLLLIIKYLRG